MSATRIDIGGIVIEGMAHKPDAGTLAAHLRRAIDANLGRQAARTGIARDIPALRVTLPHGAGEQDIADAIALAIAGELGVRR